MRRRTALLVSTFVMLGVGAYDTSPAAKESLGTRGAYVDTRVASRNLFGG